MAPAGVSWDDPPPTAPDDPVTDDPQRDPAPAIPGPDIPASDGAGPNGDHVGSAVPAVAGPAMPEYRGDELDAERGPGLGCFWVQVVLLVVLFVLTPLTVELEWPPIVSAILLFATLGLLLFVGQTAIFLLRIVAAERRGRRRPLAGKTPTVGEIEEAAGAVEGPATDERPEGDEGVRQ